MSERMERCIGVVSDTHGVLRQNVQDCLKGSELIIHAGDVGNPNVLEKLRRAAPVYAVRGNADKGKWAEALPRYEVVHWAGKYLYVIHDLNEMDLDPAAAGFDVVISGHSHRAGITERNGVLYLNAGCVWGMCHAEQITVGKLFLDGVKIGTRILDVRSPGPG